MSKLKFSELQCLVGNGYKGVQCNDVIHQAHINVQEYTGFKQKSDVSVPLCSKHHACQHSIGEITFWGEKLALAKEIGRGLHRKTLQEAQKEMRKWLKT